MASDVVRTVHERAQAGSCSHLRIASGFGLYARASIAVASRRRTMTGRIFAVVSWIEAQRNGRFESLLGRVEGDVGCCENSEWARSYWAVWDVRLLTFTLVQMRTGATLRSAHRPIACGPRLYIRLKHTDITSGGNSAAPAAAASMSTLWG